MPQLTTRRTGNPVSGGVNRATLSLGDINTETWCSRLGLYVRLDNLALYKYIHFIKSEELKTGPTMVQFSKEGYGSKRGVLPMMMVIIYIVIFIYIYIYVHIQNFPRLYMGLERGLFRWGTSINYLCLKKDACKYTNVRKEMFRSQWPRGLRHEMCSPARTLGSWVRIPLEAWMSVCGLATGLSPAHGVIPNVQRITKPRKRSGPNKGLYRHCSTNEEGRCKWVVQGIT
jgi:hypothetical protein